eukprot:TRINITY_DN1417_c0_g1_i6.p1 TRINITY_DN1417_c0_g1~~TRINITY_DN1417_c0_g1_i6.p1  ORF type:complete len:439 (-),score=60.48 TRINITY_DN1417_c0_g1_i6:415-1731(-)
MNLIIGLVLFVGLVDGATVTEFVRYREVHMDTELSCHVPTGTKRWYFNSEQSSGYQPITAENGSHYEINENIAGLRIIDTVESDEGVYLVTGDGGVSCRFELYVYGLFSYNSGIKETTITGNYEQTLYGVEGYALTVPCDYSITEVTEVENYVDVDAVVNNVNVMDCEEDMYPYCTSCVACFPLLSNLHKQFVVFPNRGSASSMLRCRVNLGTPYNGKTVDKHITVNTREVLSETVYLPYNTSYQLCSNALGNWNGVISTMTFSGGLPTNQIEYSASNLPVIVLGNDIEVSCQNLDSMGFPIGDQIYKYNITLTAIASLSNERETLTESACKDEMPENLNFNCSYQIFGPNQLKEMVVWKLNGADCSLEECAVTGEYSETSVIQLQDLSPYDQSHLVRCSVTIGNLTYYREWSINFEGISHLAFQSTTCVTIVTDIKV